MYSKPNNQPAKKTLEGLIKGRRERDYLISNKKKIVLVSVQGRNGRKLQWEVPQEAKAAIWVRDNGALNERCGSRCSWKGRYLTYTLKVKWQTFPKDWIWR